MRSSRLVSDYLNTLKGWFRSHPKVADALLALALLALALGTRLPFRSQMLHHWDSVNYALAIDHYDVRLHQPQPPGYFLYVALGAMANVILRDPQQSYVALSVLCSGLAAIALYYLGRRMYGRTVGWVAAVFLLASPSFWFYGEIAMPHTADAVLVILAVHLAYRVSKGEEKVLVPLAIVLGVAGGLRQQTLLFLLPLSVYCVRGVKASRLLGALAILATVSLAWLWPMTHLSGGIAGYRAAVMGLGTRLWQGTSIFSTTGPAGVGRNAVKLAKYTAFGWNAMAAPLLFWVLLKGYRQSRINLHPWILGLWIAPSVLFYLLIHMGNPGLVFVYLPALMLAGAAALVQLGKKTNWPKGSLACAALLTVVIAGLQFLVLPEYPFGPSGGRYLTRQAVEHHDGNLEDTVETIQRDFPIESTLVLATQWRHATYYLPGYLVLGLPGIRIEGDGGDIGTVYINCGREYGALHPSTQANRFIPEGLRWVVAFDERALQWSLDDSPWAEVSGEAGSVLLYQRLSEGQELRFTLEGYEIISQRAHSLLPAPPTKDDGL